MQLCIRKLSLMKHKSRIMDCWSSGSPPISGSTTSRGLAHARTDVFFDYWLAAFVGAERHLGRRRRGNQQTCDERSEEGAEGHSAAGVEGVCVKAGIKAADAPRIPVRLRPQGFDINY